MTISSHNEVMKEAMISQLKARLSSYLSAVRKGETVIVRDRQTRIAKLVPYRRSSEEFHMEGPEGAASELQRLSPVKLLQPVDVVESLRKDREAR